MKRLKNKSNSLRDDLNYYMGVHNTARCRLMLLSLAEREFAKAQFSCGNY